VFDLVVDEVEYPSGARGIREVARHPGGAVVVPLLDDGRLILVEQLRYPLGRRVLELPAGKLGPGEDPRLAAARELEEEAGYRAGSLRPLGSVYTTPGFCDEELHLFLATGLTRTERGPHREEGEAGMSVHLMPSADVLSMIGRGDIRDAKTIVGVLLAEHVFGFPRRPPAPACDADE
jgi:ADP-ribose pyrophosphatase